MHTSIWSQARPQDPCLRWKCCFYHWAVSSQRFIFYITYFIQYLCMSLQVHLQHWLRAKQWLMPVSHTFRIGVRITCLNPTSAPCMFESHSCLMRIWIPPLLHECLNSIPLLCMSESHPCSEYVWVLPCLHVLPMMGWIGFCKFSNDCTLQWIGILYRVPTTSCAMPSGIGSEPTITPCWIHKWMVLIDVVVMAKVAHHVTYERNLLSGETWCHGKWTVAPQLLIWCLP